MLLKKLTLSDIGTYAGSQDFDLVPRTKYGSKRPIVLFGGLNGSGKTTFLTAVRLALYGRQSLDFTPTQKQYDEYLLDLIHRQKDSLVRSTHASISLEFEHAKMGERATYRVVRYWNELTRGVEESLSIYRDNSDEPYLNNDQAQAFLNQLVPPGVAQFFFFDGEKIAALAKDDTDVVLADAIHRLLGLDLVDRLNSDLNVFLRSHRASLGDKKARDEIAALENELEKIDGQYKKLETERVTLDSQRSTAKDQYQSKKADLSAQGGAWSVNRVALERELDDLQANRRHQEDALRDALNGAGIFVLAKQLGSRVVERLRTEGHRIESESVRASVETRASELRALLSSSLALPSDDYKKLDYAINQWISGFISAESTDGAYGLSSADIRRAIELIDSQVKLDHQNLRSLYQTADGLLQREETIQDQLAHAPNDESIKFALEQLTSAAEEVGYLEAKWKALVEEQRKLTWQSIDIVRKLRKVEEKLAEESDVQRGHVTAEATQEVIAEFKVAAAKHKCEQLRSYFVAAFTRLARKEDIIRDARIDPETFRVTLIDRADREVPKKRLSAGEKQIYSIAMLEALAKTSGRNLPVIIDTPLGRLDSKHRTKLVESYFPVASHQVIILSTDTEVDSTFYESLSTKISHAYHLAFDEQTGSTNVEAGYFWKHSPEVRAHAS